MTQEPVAIIGGGAWGTAPVVSLGRRGVPGTLWMHEDDLVSRMLARRIAAAEMPIVEEAYRILYEDGAPRDAVRRLMTRPLGSEDRSVSEIPT